MNAIKQIGEQYEEFTTRIGRKLVKRVQYDYRAPDGQLFSTVDKTVEEARNRRDEWLQTLAPLNTEEL